MPLLRRCDANSGSNVRPATCVPDHRPANSEKEATLTKQANNFRGRIFSREDIFARGYFREKIFSREDISREDISNSLFAKFSSRENKVLYSTHFGIGHGGRHDVKRHIERAAHIAKAQSRLGSINRFVAAK